MDAIINKPGHCYKYQGHSSATTEFWHTITTDHGSCSPPLAWFARGVSFSSVPPLSGCRQFNVRRRCSDAQSLFVIRAESTVVVNYSVTPIMTPVPLEIIETKILKPFKYPRVVHEGYLYHFHKKCSRHLRWKCNRVYSLKCPAVIRTNLDILNPQCIAVDHEHVHGNDLVAIEQLKLKLRLHQTSTSFK
jgi:hypothetical protein